MLDRGSLELMDDRPLPAPLPPEAERLNQRVGFARNCVKPPDGETERVELTEPGDEPPEAAGTRSGGLSELEDAPRRGGIVDLRKREVGFAG